MPNDLHYWSKSSSWLFFSHNNNLSKTVFSSSAVKPVLVELLIEKETDKKYFSLSTVNNFYQINPSSAKVGEQESLCYILKYAITIPKHNHASPFTNFTSTVLILKHISSPYLKISLPNQIARRLMGWN